jgi:site-specific DNA recombinase
VPAIVDLEIFELVAEKLSHNQKHASRNNKSHRYLLRSLVGCGACKQGSNARTTWDGRSYYVCRGHNAVVPQHRCRTRHVPATELERLVWEDLCKVLTHPEHIRNALQRAYGGEWLPQELKARLSTVGKAITQIEWQKRRLLDAYLGGVLEVPELRRKRKELDGRSERVCLLNSASLKPAPTNAWSWRR